MSLLVGGLGFAAPAGQAKNFLVYRREYSLSLSLSLELNGSVGSGSFFGQWFMLVSVESIAVNIEKYLGFGKGGNG
jgi:hypothetical protein